MALVVVNGGEEKMLDLILAVNMTMRLFTNDVISGLTASQIEALTVASFTEATFTGYSAKALTGGSWVTTQADPSTGTYAQQTYTRTSTGATQNVRGYYMTRTSDNALMWFEYFDGVIATSTNGDTIRITPTFTLDDDQEATVAARGMLDLFSTTVASSGYTSTTTTDMVLSNFDADSTRSYRIGLSASTYINGSGSWYSFLRIDGTRVARLGISNGSSGITETAHAGTYTWEPATGQYDLDIEAFEVSGTAQFVYAADATYTRQFWIEDVGPR